MVLICVTSHIAIDTVVQLGLKTPKTVQLEIWDSDARAANRVSDALLSDVWRMDLPMKEQTLWKFIYVSKKYLFIDFLHIEYCEH